MKTLLVTGADGFAGSNFVHWLKAQTKDDLQIKYVLQGRKSQPLSVGSGDLSDFNNAARLVTACRPDIILHCAGRVPYANRHVSDESFMRDNAQATQALVAAASALERKPHIIYPASVSVYPAHGIRAGYRDIAHRIVYTRPRDALSLAELNFAYARSKKISEQALQSYEGPWTILRMPTVIGADDGRGNFLQLLALRVLSRQSSPLAQRCTDYLSVADAAIAIGSSIGTTASHRQILNVGSGHAITDHRAWIGMLDAAALRDIDVSFNSVPEEEDETVAFAGRILDIAPAQQLLGFHPQISFRSMCSRVWDDILKRPSPLEHLQKIFPDVTG